ncbi:phosphoglucomutase [Plasmodium brasilianum]|uniref:Phosphoglucomutase, putative n=2 Tax=Plasmodium (Plasmodium) TaxID=418103 RepID=A0A1A8X500_PLAMA|nr:phosphoglucomutase, putative [Plasmodium malariae]KAI4838820.1 phosphoglucomutase [Plasmodium brasilianum]SBS98833.1 phosphoglucomutase, putative [Plasmodium malariae]SCN12160.1 phosphoglucomutase, putative [Plasmodium malariae]
MDRTNSEELATMLNLWDVFKKPKYLVDKTEEVINKYNEDELKKLFLNRLNFGTAGLRGKMGVGFNAMNVVTIMQTTQGLCTYLINTYGLNLCKNRGIIFGFDGRYHSESFAHVAAAVCLSKGFRVYLFGQTVATPILCYSNLKKNCLCGVMVTASHNPKLDNGYKVYAANGAQIIPPVDKLISECILNNLNPWCGIYEYLNEEFYLKDTSLVEDIYFEMYDSFMSDMKNEFNFNCYRNSRTKLVIVYSPMHGIGRKFVQGIMHIVGFNNLLTVPLQALPDADFSTVTFPNPEEKGALDLSMQLADLVNSPIVVANDPDADRFACAEKFNNKWYVFSGDELGIIFAYHLMKQNEKKNIDKSKHVFICTVVCSRMLKKLCETYGYRYDETLTGFKWLINKAIEYNDKNYTTLYCYEEALGHALTRHVMDKCGISALAYWIEIAVYLYENNLTFHDYLEIVRKEIGYFVSNNGYYTVLDPNDIVSIFNEFRSNGSYKTSLGSYKIVRIRDLTTGYDSTTHDKKSLIAPTPDSQNITLHFENTAVLTIRASGTEPKVKWYSEISRGNYEEAKKEIDALINEVLPVFMQPHKFNIKKC